MVKLRVLNRVPTDEHALDVESPDQKEAAGELDTFATGDGVTRITEIV